MFGFLNVNKPQGITSREVVDRVQRLVRPVKVGHAGTLDPLATGVLVVCLGPATRLVPYVQQQAKCYRATFLLGRRSETDDVDGDVIELPGAIRPSHAQLVAALPQFVGDIRQRPPDYAAVKIRGRRAYDLARRGHPVQLAERPVSVYELTLRAFEYPELQLDIRCGSGTYVRALGRDIARELGTTAVMSALVRTSIGGFRIEDAVPADELNASHVATQIVPATRGVDHLPQVEVDHDDLERLRKGLTISRTVADQAVDYAAVDCQGQLVAIVAPRGLNQLRPVRNFPVRSETE